MDVERKLKSLTMGVNHMWSVMENTLFLLDEIKAEGNEEELMKEIIRSWKYCKEECDNFSRYAGRRIQSFEQQECD